MDLLDGSGDSPISFNLSTFGCKVNTYDSGLLEQQLRQKGFAAEGVSCAKVHVLNSCAVTAEATQEVIRRARRLKRDHPESLVVVTGCSAQVDTEKLESQLSIDLIVANSHKSQIGELILERLMSRTPSSDVLRPLVRTIKSNIFKKEEFGSGGGLESGHTRAFLKIQDGCDSFCTFCVIPFSRGKSRSLPIEDLRRRVNELLSEGAREVVLTGVHIGDYEFGLENLIEDLLLHTRVPRLRLTSLEPVELSDRLLELYDDPRMCRHFHMSIQSASTSVLCGMKRKYSADDVVASLHKISRRVSGAFVGMDVIAGFPGEGENEFTETYSRLNDTPWTRIHVFPYSERPGTYAIRMNDKVARSVIARRADRLRELSQERYVTAARAQIGLIKKALVLKNGRALSRDYWNIECVNSEAANERRSEESRVKVIAVAQTPSRLESPLVGEIIG